MNETELVDPPQEWQSWKAGDMIGLDDGSRLKVNYTVKYSDNSVEISLGIPGREWPSREYAKRLYDSGWRKVDAEARAVTLNSLKDRLVRLIANEFRNA